MATIPQLREELVALCNALGAPLPARAARKGELELLVADARRAFVDEWEIRDAAAAACRIVNSGRGGAPTEGRAVILPPDAALAARVRALAAPPAMGTAPREERLARLGREAAEILVADARRAREADAEARRAAAARPLTGRPFEALLAARA